MSAANCERVTRSDVVPVAREVTAIGQAARGFAPCSSHRADAAGISPRCGWKPPLAGRDYRIVGAGPSTAQFQLAHAHRLAGLDVGDHHLASVPVDQFGPHLDVVVAERLERFANFFRVARSRCDSRAGASFARCSLVSRSIDRRARTFAAMSPSMPRSSTAGGSARRRRPATSAIHASIARTASFHGRSLSGAPAHHGPRRDRPSRAVHVLPMRPGQAPGRCAQATESCSTAATSRSDRRGDAAGPAGCRAPRHPRHHHHAVEERIHRRAQPRQPAQHAEIVARGQQRIGIGDRLGSAACKACSAGSVSRAGETCSGTSPSFLRRMLRMRFVRRGQGRRLGQRGEVSDGAQTALEIHK